MEKLYKFFWDCGRMGKVEGVFVADDKKVEANIGKEVYFGEILGKHSEIFGTLGWEDLIVLTENQEAIAILKEHVGADISGYNPISVIEEREKEEAEEHG